MEIYRIKTSNTELRGELREYFVLAENIGAAEEKALAQMWKEMPSADRKLGQNYAFSAELLGSLVR